jgi:phage terminase large subunit-like protein
MAAKRAPKGVHARDYTGIANRWARDVVTGKVVACKWVRLACERHLADLRRKNWAYRFDRWHADDVCDFIEKLPHVEGHWETPTIRLEPVQIFILAIIFGWRRVADGHRRFSMVYIEMARKGAKSTLSAGVALYCLCCEGEVGPQVVIGASTGDQANKVFDPAKKIVEREPDLREAYDLQTFVRSITCGNNGGYIQTINAKASTQDGWNPHVGILDELHAHKDRALFDVIKSAFGARRNPLLWMITTAGYNMAGVCYEQRSLVCKMLEGIIELDHYFGIIFTIDDGDDPFDERVWIKANPMLGITPTVKSMRDYAEEAKISPSSEGEFKTKRLNIWLNAASAWLNMAQWNACADPTLSWDAFKGLECYIGGDLADKDDITAIVLAAYEYGEGLPPEGRLILKPVFWLPEAVLRHPAHAEGRGPAPYRAWATDGFLRLTPGDWVDHNNVEDQVRDWIDTYSVRKCTFDQFAAAQAMASRLNEDLATPDDPLAVILYKKASTVTDAAKELERRIKAGPRYIRHDGNPVMTWMASNVVVARRRDETLLPIKESEHSPNKIDGIDALINAIDPTIDRGLSEDEGVEIPDDYRISL